MKKDIITEYYQSLLQEQEDEAHQAFLCMIFGLSFGAFGILNLYVGSSLFENICSIALIIGFAIIANLCYKNTIKKHYEISV